jgi:hypothetical protein
LSLEEYEATEHVDNWDMNFSVGVHYGDKPFEKVRDIRDKLISAGTSVDKLRLSHASAVARGNVVWAVLPSYGKG